MSWILCDSITYSLLQPLKVFMQETLVFEEHAVCSVEPNEAVMRLAVGLDMP